MQIDADATALIISDNSENRKKCMQMSKVLEWINANSLNWNIDKTSLIRFQNRQNTCDISFTVNDNTDLTTHENSIKFLDLHMNGRFNWGCRCNFVTSKLNSTSYQLRNVSLFNVAQLLILDYAQVKCRIRYGICCWSLSSSAQYMNLARALAGLKSTESCKKYFKLYNILTLPSLLI